MLFTSDEFLVFLGGVVGTLQVLRGGASRRWAMLAFCVWFYASWSLQFLGLLVGSVALDWAIALRLGKDTRPSVRRALVIASIAMNLGMLGVFKYAGFAAVTLNDGLRLLGTGLRVPVPHLILPLGISFYIFQSISYTVDVYRGLLPPTRSLRDLATFVMFFPHLVSGPIVRAAELLPQLARLDTPAPAEDLAVGARHFVLGFARKVLVADTLAPLLHWRVCHVWEWLKHWAPTAAYGDWSTAMIADADMARAMLLSLKNQGVRIALDDFGTGYSSLVLLRDLPIDKVKIDRSFVSHVIDGDGPDGKIIDAILGMAQALKLSVTAEGIETEAAAQALREKGCQFGQGYLFSAAQAELTLDLRSDQDPQAARAVA